MGDAAGAARAPENKGEHRRNLGPSVVEKLSMFVRVQQSLWLQTTQTFLDTIQEMRYSADTII
jgi:hypothetical protein